MTTDKTKPSTEQPEQPEQPQPAAKKKTPQPEKKPARKGADKIRRYTIETN